MIIKNREILKCTAASLYISCTSFSIKGEEKKKLWKSEEYKEGKYLAPVVTDLFLKILNCVVVDTWNNAV